MRWSWVFVVFAVACRGDDEPAPPSRMPAPAASSVARGSVSLVVAERIAVAATRSTTLHVEVANRAAIDGVVVIDPTRVPSPIGVEQGVVGLKDSGTDIVVHVPSDMNPYPAYGRIELSLVTTRGVEATAEVLVDVDGAPGRLIRIDTIPLDRVSALHVDAEDRVVAVGEWSEQASVVRETAKGGPDTKFGAFGAVRLFPASSSSETASRADAAASYPDGALIVGGTRGRSTFALPERAPFVVRLRTDGTVDEAFAYAPREGRRLGGLAVDGRERAILAFEPSSSASGAVEIVALSRSGAALAEISLPAPGMIADVTADTARRVHVAFSDGTLVRLGEDLSIEATTKVSRPFTTIAFRRARDPVVLRGGKIDDGAGFEPETTQVAEWSAVAAHSDSTIVAAGSDGFVSTYLARFWP